MNTTRSMLFEFARACAMQGLWLAFVSQSSMAAEQAPLAIPDQEGARLAEVTVTARKREEPVIDVPASVQVLSGAQLQKDFQSNSTDLFTVVPNLYFGGSALSPGRDLDKLVMRGVGADISDQPGVAVVVDGVYQPSLAFDTDFLDTDRVEVLKGPQGTLFGRNAEGGVINIVLRRPDETFRSHLAATWDNFDTARIQGQVSGPLTDQFFSSLAVDLGRTGGFLDDPTLGGVSADRNRTFAARVAWRYRPDDSLDINLALDGSTFAGLSGLPGVPRGLDRYQVLDTFLEDGHNQSFGGALNITRRFDDIELTSSTGFRRLGSRTPYDFSGGPVDGIFYPNELSDLRVTQRIYSEELRLAGQSGARQHWLLGAYGFWEQSHFDRVLDFPFLPAFQTSYTSPAQNQHLTDRGAALFANVSYDLNTRLGFDAGLRYGRESTRSDFFQSAVIPGFFFADSGVSAQISNNYLMPSLSALVHVRRDLSLYTRYARGYRSAGFPIAPTPSTDIPYKDETSDNYEVGMKGGLGSALNFDLSLFDIERRNQQVQSVAFIDGNPDLPVSAITNAGRSLSRGMEANIVLVPVQRLELRTDFGYTDAHYVEYVDSVGKNRAGDKLPFVPRVTASQSAEYVLPWALERAITLYVQYQHVSDMLSGNGIDPDLQFRVKAYDLVNSRLSFALSPHVTIDAFCNNVFDKFVEVRVYNAFFFGAPRPFSTVLPPRNVGLRLTYRH